MESVCCIFCRKNETHSLFLASGTMPNRGQFQLARCVACRLIYLNPRPSAEELKTYYPAWTVSAEQEALAEVTPEETRKREMWKYHLLPANLKKGGGSVLDIGAGAGEFLYLMREKGWQTTGVEPSPVTSRYAREAFGLEVLTGTLPEVVFSPESFDLITLWDVLEHLPDPLDVMKKVASLLKESGKVVFSTPNIEGLPARWFKNAWYTNVPRHLYFFSPGTLQLLLQQSGLELTAIRHHHSLFTPTSFASSFKRWLLGQSLSFDKKAREWLETAQRNSPRTHASPVFQIKTLLEQTLECVSLPVALFCILTHQAPNLTVYATKPSSHQAVGADLV